MHHRIIPSALLILLPIAFHSVQLVTSFGSQSSSLHTFHHAPFRSKVELQSTFSPRAEGAGSLKQSRRNPGHHRTRNAHSTSKNNKNTEKRDTTNKPIGTLDDRELKHLCSLIRVVGEGYVYKSLNILERILLELDTWDGDSRGEEDPSVLLKPIHVFGVLTAISRDVRRVKETHRRKSNSPRVAGLNARGIKQLQNVVMLLKKLVGEDKLAYCDEGCYNEDVISFATMITADAGRYEPSGVDAAMYFLQLMEDEGDNRDWDPRLIGAVLNSLAQWGRAEKAQSLLAKAMGVNITDVHVDHKTLSRRRLDPSQAISCYDALLRGFSKQSVSQKEGQLDSASLSESKAVLSKGSSILLQHMPNVPGLSISNRTCAAALQGYGALGLGKDADRLLTDIEMMLQTPTRTAFTSNLDSACYNTILMAHCQSQKKSGIARAEYLLYSMVNRQHVQHNISNAPPVEILPPRADFVSYSTLLNYYSKDGMANEAEILLESMISSAATNPTAPIPTAASYLSVIRAIGKSGQEDAPERIMSLINKVEQLNIKKYINQTSKYQTESLPNRAMYVSALRYVSKFGRALEAGELFGKLRSSSLQSDKCTDIQASTLVLRAWGWTHQVDREEAAIQAEALLRDLQASVKKGHLKPLDVNIYNIVLNCYAKAGLNEKATALLKEMHPNGISYGLVIKAISKSNRKDAVDLAWEVLDSLGYDSDRLSPVFENSIEPFNSMLRLLAKRGLASEAENLLNFMDEMYYDRILNLRPNVASYEAVLEALGRCKDQDSASRAEALLTRMDVLSDLGGSRIQPSLVAYNHLINCYGNAGMSNRAERLFDQLKKNNADLVRPDKYTVGSTIKAIINGAKNQENSLTSVSSLVKESSEFGGANNKVISAYQLKLYTKFGMGHEAETMLRQMHKPGLIHYTIVLDAWAKSNADDSTQRAEALFREMQDTLDFDLDIKAYNALMIGYSSRGQIQKAETLMEQILSHPSITPNRKTFTMLINAYNNALNKPSHAIERVEELLDKMRELHASGNNEAEPDDVTYRAIIKCIRNDQGLEVTDTEKLALKSRLQLERWPYDEL